MEALFAYYSCEVASELNYFFYSLKTLPTNVFSKLHWRAYNLFVCVAINATGR